MGLLEWLSLCSDVERHVVGRYARELMDNNCHADGKEDPNDTA
jgi:hypothetical protein